MCEFWLDNFCALSEWLSVFVLASVGPMITDTETERLSKGFTFGCFVFGLFL
jgi:hypothetical protein